MTASSGLLSFVWFLAILALIPLALWLLKRTRFNGSPGAGLRLVSMLPLSPHQRVLIVEVGEGEERRWLVLGATSQQITALHSLPPQSEPPQNSPTAASFAKLLSKERGGA